MRLEDSYMPTQQSGRAMGRGSPAIPDYNPAPTGPDDTLIGGMSGALQRERNLAGEVLQLTRQLRSALIAPWPQKDGGIGGETSPSGLILAATQDLHLSSDNLSDAIDNLRAVLRELGQ